MKNLRTQSLSQIQALLEEHHQPAYRAQQIWDWLWKKNCVDIDQMSNLPIEFRELLKTHYTIPVLTTANHQHSKDGTIKTKIVLHDNLVVEGVLIPTENRMTACISSQVGCSLSCKFCATGKMDRIRNLEFDEIVDEVVQINKMAVDNYQKKLTNIVYMGMGEPLLNYQNVLQSIEKITSPDALGMSPKRITVSTAGVAKMIKKLGDDEVKFNLALSLHAPTDAKRDQIMPINETNTIQALIDAMNYYYQKTKNPITFEYLLLRDFNDSEQDAIDLVKIARKVPSKVNLIEYNAIGDGLFSKTEDDNALKFMSYLNSKKVNARLRKSRGIDIDAACGQLANK